MTLNIVHTNLFIALGLMAGVVTLRNHALLRLRALLR